MGEDLYGRLTLRVVNKKRGAGAGVRKDVRGCLFVDSLPRVYENVLSFDQPCICGSYTHRTRRSSKCLLNSQYMDVT